MKGETCEKCCTKKDFKKANFVLQKTVKYYNHFVENLDQNLTRFTLYFAPGGLYSTSINPTTVPYFPESNFYDNNPEMSSIGEPINIYTYLYSFVVNSGQTDFKLKIRQTNWDCDTRTLGVQMTWSSILTAPRDFGGINLPSGASYSQDFFVIYRFDCEYNIVYYRQYHDSTQFVSTYTNKYPHVCGSKPGDYLCALQVLNGLNFAINMASPNPKLSASLFASHFSKCGIWSIPNNPSTYPYTLPLPQNVYRGPREVFDFLYSYTSNPGEKNQTVSNRQINWDPSTRTLFVQRSWTATLTSDRTFYTNPPIILSTGTTYQQDDFIIIRFDVDFKILYYREYFDNAQYISTYTELFPPVCICHCSPSP